MPVRRTSAVGQLRHHVHQARSRCREREDGTGCRPFHPGLHLACHRRDARVLQQRDHAGIGRPGGCPLPRPQGDGRMEATAADTGVCLQTCHMFRPAGKNSDRRTAQSGTGHRRLPADGGHAADDPREDDGTQPRTADLNRHLRARTGGYRAVGMT